MKRHAWPGVLFLLLGVAGSEANAGPVGWVELPILNHCLYGRIIDYTNHHGSDHRIWSDALQCSRNLYVYLPPGYDPDQQYPLLIWLQGYADNDHEFNRRALGRFDRAIVCGTLPPVIIACPSGHIPGRITGSLFLNTKAGAYEDLVVQDIMNFMTAHYPIRPEREARVLVGISGGGWAAYCLAMRHRDCFGVVVGILPTLNVRWLDCHGNYRSHFDPCCWGMRCDLKNDLLGIYYGIPVTFKSMVKPFFGWGPETLDWISEENPIELIDRTCLQPGELAMYVGYIGHDQLHVDAQVESFVYLAQQRGLCVTVDFRPELRGHNFHTGTKFIAAVAEWLGPQMAPYSPGLPADCPTAP